jgi:hypothetical protein
MAEFTTAPRTRTIAQANEADDLRSVVTAALAARPIDESALRRGVWSYVGEERHARTSPGHVIIALTDLIDRAAITDVKERHALTRRVILWCVESYFGHLGGDVFGREGTALSDMLDELPVPLHV